MVSLTKVAFAGFAALSLSACAGSGIGDNDTERAVIGAAAGAVVADATDNDVATGAAVGGLAGVFCDDAGICR
ncbi:hypothetical protein AAD018_004875 [Aestuariibius insulae]|uniref:hypothetical protein n=1 Tax=Aestuariibius insulae TaxID=2058287 RepID=UPI00345E6BAF